jgi:putative MATE family efflux protein
VPPARFDASGSLSRQLYGLAWPAFGENVLQTTLQIVSLALVGRLGATTIAAVGLANQIYFVAVVVLMGWSVGTTALVARQIGAGQSASAGQVARQSMLTAAAASVVLGVVLYLLAGPALLAAGANSEVVEPGEPFLRILTLSVPGAGLMLVGSGALRGAGDTRTPMYATGIANAINIVLAYALVLGAFGAPALGASGAAWSIVVARTVGAVIVTWLVWRRSTVRAGSKLVDFEVARRVARIGAPAAGEQLIVQTGFVAFNLIAIRIGTNEFAAMQISFNVAQVSQLAGLAFATAATTLVGQSLGAGRPDLARRAGWIATGTAVVWMIAVGVLFILFGDAIFGIYGADEEVRALGRTALIIMGFGQAPQGIAFVLSGALRGAGDTRATLIGGILGTCALRAPVSYLTGLALGWGFVGIWIAWMLDWIARSILFGLRFRSDRWEKVRV